MNKSKDKTRGPEQRIEVQLGCRHPSNVTVGQKAYEAEYTGQLPPRTLEPQGKNILAALYEHGRVTVWNGILQGEEISISRDLEDLGLATISPIQYHGNVRVSLTKKGKIWGKALARAGYKSTYSEARE